MSAHTFRICFIYALVSLATAALPSYIHVCHLSDPQIESCITNSIEILRPLLAKGMPEINVPPVEPLLLKNIHLQRGPNSANIFLNLTNMKVYGPSKFKIHNLKFDRNTLTFSYHLLFDKLHFKGKYQIDARVLLLELKGSGDMSGNFYNYDGDVIMKSHKIQKNNKNYLHFERMKFRINVGKAEFNLSNLFNGDEILERATNDLLKDNGELFLDEVKPLLETTLEDIFTDISNKITRSLTFEELFPDD